MGEQYHRCGTSVHIKDGTTQQIEDPMHRITIIAVRHTVQSQFSRTDNTSTADASTGTEQ